MFIPIFLEMIQFDKYFSNGLKPPTSRNHIKRLEDPFPFQTYPPGPRLLPVEIAPWELSKWHVQPAFLGFFKKRLYKGAKVLDGWVFLWCFIYFEV